MIKENKLENLPTILRSSPAVEAALSSSHESWHSQRGSDIEPVQPISRLQLQLCQNPVSTACMESG